MTNEEIKNRVHSIETLIEAQRRYEEIQSSINKKIQMEYGEEPEYPDEYLQDAYNSNFEQEVSDYWQDVTYRAEEYDNDEAWNKMRKDTRVINQKIEKGDSLEKVADYIEKNQSCIDLLEIDYLDCDENTSNLEDEFISYNSQYAFDTWAGYIDLARDLAKKGIEPKDLPETTLFDLSFIGDYVQAVALTREEEIDKDFRSELIDFFDYLKARENPKEQFKQSISVKDIANAIQQQGLSKEGKEKDDDENIR